MEFGMPTLIELDTLADNARLCQDLGLCFVELNMNLPHCQLSALSKGLPHLEGVGYTLHLDENLNVCDFNPLVAGAWTRTALEAGRLAQGEGIPVLNLHLSRGVHFTLPGRKVYLYEQYPRPYLDALARFGEAAAALSGVKYSVENCGGFLPVTREGVEGLLGHENFQLTWDVGHDHSGGGLDAPFLRRHADRVRHMHLHDADGSGDHLALGTGEVDLAEKLAFARDHACRCVVEVKTVEGLRQSAGYLRAGGWL